MKRNKAILVSMFALMATSQNALASGHITKNQLTGKSGSRTVSLKTDSKSGSHRSIFDSPIVVLPEVSTVVSMNSGDVNRIVCPEEIKDVVFLAENGIAVKVTGKDAFVNFKFVEEGEKTTYSTKPSEMYVVCGENTYNLIVQPRMDVPPQTIRLSSGMEKKIKTNKELYGGLPFEKKVMTLVKEVYTDNIGDNHTVQKVNKPIGNWLELSIIHARNVLTEGEGLLVKEYRITLKQSQVPFKLSEKLFTKKQFADNPVAVSLEKHIVRPGETVRVFVVEQKKEQGFNGSNGESLMLKSETEHADEEDADVNNDEPSDQKDASEPAKKEDGGK